MHSIYCTQPPLVGQPSCHGSSPHHKKRWPFGIYFAWGYYLQCFASMVQKHFVHFPSLSSCRRRQTPSFTEFSTEAGILLHWPWSRWEILCTFFQVAYYALALLDLTWNCNLFSHMEVCHNLTLHASDQNHRLGPHWARAASCCRRPCPEKRVTNVRHAIMKPETQAH